MTENTKAAVQVSDLAGEKILSLLNEAGKDSSHGLRINVMGGGCSGFQYMMDFDEHRDGDNVFENGDAKVFIDDKSLPFVSGSLIDFNTGLQGAGFVVTNPNATGTCGCGSSFSV